jgi:hypothetical protein
LSESVAGKIILFIILIPIYALLIWTLIDPRESLLFGKRWMYNEEPELSDEYLRFTKFVTVFIIVILTIFSIIVFFKL